MLVEAHPDSATAYAARAGIEKDRGMLELAEYDYGKAFELDRKNIDYLINRADIRISLCRMSEARRDLDLATKLGYPRPALTEFYRRLRKK